MSYHGGGYATQERARARVAWAKRVLFDGCNPGACVWPKLVETVHAVWHDAPATVFCAESKRLRDQKGVVHIPTAVGTRYRLQVTDSAGQQVLIRLQKGFEENLLPEVFRRRDGGWKASPTAPVALEDWLLAHVVGANSYLTRRRGRDLRAAWQRKRVGKSIEMTPPTLDQRKWLGVFLDMVL